jgi:large subunit ribosomal protein L35
MANKAKTRKSASRRFKITGTGKVMRRVSFGRHLRRKKSAGQLRGYKVNKQVTGKLARRVKRLMALA